MRFKPPKFLRELMPELVWDIPAGGDVFLTFDDGPTPGVTEWILDELARHDARATFFCLGRNVELYPELYARILAAGHRVGNHTHNHLKGWGCDAVRYAADVDRAARTIDSPLFRPPYGRISPREARLVGQRYRIVMWNIISRDYNRRLSPHTCLENVVRHVQAGDIIVFHDSLKAFRNMSYALPRTLEYLRERGMNSKAIEL
ncbi:MAG: polysaccharide deacetylase family protein [Alistipes sp.]|jgi:peptidoglycan/xylan/chitin deacetylase (PgdA/CDA1 family)|nr:polysaccharide deacetylase family protein [Alistipes sp.]